MTRRIAAALLCVSAFAACGGNECKLGDPKACASGLVCEKVSGKTTGACFAPVLLEGTVTRSGSTTPIDKAEVSATDATGLSVGAVAVTGADGKYSLPISSERKDEKGAPVGRTVTLRAGASNHFPFPAGVRVALPIDTSAAASAGEGKPWTLNNSLTAISLIAVPDGERNRPSVSGTVELGATQPAALVVLDSTSGPRTALTDAAGAFKIFNVPPGGGLKVSAYSAGANFTPVTVDVQAGNDVTGVAIKKAAGATATLNGSVQLVAGANGAGTSVVLVVESTFIESIGRGELVPGLRAPSPGTTPNITGSYSIAGIPDGKYVVLAAFENDDNVRDPDPGISGTQIARITVSGGANPSVPAFKVTKAVEMVSPGASGAIEEVAGTPTFAWKPFSNADAYVLRVYDAQGAEVWNTPVLDLKDAQGNISRAYAGPTLSAGLVYQWRVTALRKLAPTSLTEELKGLFSVK